MKRILLMAALSSVMTSGSAEPLWHPAGSNLTLGDISHGRSILSDVTNPASAAALLRSGKNQYGFGIISSIGAGYEYGDIDNLYQKIDSEINNIQGTTIAPGDDPNTVISQTVDTANTLLSQIEDKGYGKVLVSGQIPLMPIIIANKGIGGALVFDINYSATSKVINLHQPIQYNSLNDPNDDIDYNSLNNTFSVTNDTSLLVSGAAIVEGALGYSRNVWTQDTGELYAGVKAKYLRVGLIRVAQRLADPALQDSQTAFDNVGDNDYTDSANIGVDLGLLWVNDHYRLGATFTNINQPHFKYNSLSLTGYDPNSSVYQRLQSLPDYTMETQAKLEAAMFTESLNWVVGAAVDANAVKDPFGDSYQWANVSAGFTPNSFWIPGMRAGFRTNMAGSKLSMVEAGFTFFKMLNIDGAYGLQEVEFDNKKYPRTAYVNIGLELTF